MLIPRSGGLWNRSRMTLNRRHLLAALPLVALGACAGPMGTYSVEEGVRRLLELSSQRAFARSLRPGGFYDDQLTRIDPPGSTGGTNDILGAVLRTNAVRRQVAIALNDVAVALEASLGESETAKLIWKPQAPAEVSDLDHAQKLMKLIDTLEEDDDVQTVWGNYDVSDEVMEKLG